MSETTQTGGLSAEDAGIRREKSIVRAGIVGIAVNLILVAFKGTIGYLIGSVAIISDAVNNLTDALSSVVTIIGAKLANKDPDKKHPYGHGRIEYISSMIIGVLIVYAGVTTFIDSFEKALSPEAAHYDAAAIIIIVAAVAAKLLLGMYFKRKGKSADSQALTASGTDSINDALVSSTILIGAAIVTFTGVSIDGWLGMAISAFVVKSGIQVLRDSVSSIIGERVPAEESKALKKEIASFDGVLGAYDLILNRYGPQATIGSVHIEVKDDMTAQQIDVLSRRIETEVYGKHRIILTVGVYAAGTENEESAAIKKTIEQIVKKEPDVLELHGYYADLQSKSVRFDIVVGYDCKDRKALINRVIGELRAAYPDYTFTVQPDNDF